MNPEPQASARTLVLRAGPRKSDSGMPAVGERVLQVPSRPRRRKHGGVCAVWGVGVEGRGQKSTVWAEGSVTGSGGRREVKVRAQRSSGVGDVGQREWEGQRGWLMGGVAACEAAEGAGQQRKANKEVLSAVVSHWIEVEIEIEIDISWPVGARTGA
eukprot:3941120-Rhodomonas_salina.2